MDGDAPSAPNVTQVLGEQFIALPQRLDRNHLASRQGRKERATDEADVGSDVEEPVAVHGEVPKRPYDRGIKRTGQVEVPTDMIIGHDSHLESRPGTNGHERFVEPNPA